MKSIVLSIGIVVLVVCFPLLRQYWLPAAAPEQTSAVSGGWSCRLVQGNKVILLEYDGAGRRLEKAALLDSEGTVICSWAPEQSPSNACTELKEFLSMPAPCRTDTY